MQPLPCVGEAVSCAPLPPLGYYPKGGGPKDELQAQVDMIEESLKWAGVTTVSSVGACEFMSLNMKTLNPKTPYRGSTPLDYTLNPRENRADDRRGLRHRGQQPAHLPQVWLQRAGHHAEPQAGSARQRAYRRGRSGRAGVVPGGRRASAALCRQQL